MRDHEGDDRAQPAADAGRRGRAERRARGAGGRIRLTARRAVALGLALVSAAGGCTAGEGPTEHRASLWLELVADRGLKPSREAVQVDVAGGPPALDVRICAPLDAEGELAFADALFGAEAFAFDGRWERVDTAEMRAEIAPLLRAGECGTVELPVEEAGGYRVLVPVGGLAAWGDGG